MSDQPKQDLPGNLDPQDNSFMKQGQDLLDEKRYADALAWFEKAVAQDPTNALAWKQCGYIHFLREQFQESLDAFEHALALNPTDYRALDAKGAILGRFHRNQEALAVFDQGLQARPRAVTTLYNKATVLCDMNHLNEAKAVLLTLVEIQPNNGVAWRLLGNTYNNLKQPQEALHVCDHTLEVAPQLYREVWLLQIQAYLLLQKFDQALGVCDAFLAEDSSKQIVWRQKIFALRALKRAMDALHATEAALALFPQEQMFWNEKAQILFSVKRFKEGAKALRESAYLQAIERKNRR